MTAARALLLYRGLFAGYIVYASLRTLLAGAAHGGHAVLLLAGVEIAAALAFLHRPARRVAGVALLLVFATAFVLGLTLGEVPLQLVLYAGTVGLLLALDQDAPA